MVVVDFPNPEHWREVQQYGSTKYKLQPWRHQGRQCKRVSMNNIFYDKMLFLISLVKKFCYLWTIL